MFHQEHPNHSQAAIQLPPSQSQSQSQPQTKIVFVGNLSYFCEDHHLHDLFNEYGQVDNARVMRSDDNTRSLMFGFVTMASVNQAKEVTRIFSNNGQGHMFMGRKIRVALSDKRENTRPWNDQTNPGVQVHISFGSFFDVTDEEQRKKMLRPTESFIRRALVDQGNILDVTIKEYHIHDNLQEGYGFITVPSIDNAVELTTNFKQVASQGITLTCTLTHKHNPNHRVKKSNKAAPRSITPPSGCGAATTSSSDREDSSLSGRSEGIPPYSSQASVSSFPPQTVAMPINMNVLTYANPEIIPFPGHAFTQLVAPSPPPSSYSMVDAAAMYPLPSFQHQQQRGYPSQMPPQAMLVSPNNGYNEAQSYENGFSDQSKHSARRDHSHHHNHYPQLPQQQQLHQQQYQQQQFRSHYQHY